MTQTIEYVVKVNASAANAAVAEVEKRFGGLDNVVSKIDKGIIALERDMKDLDAAIRAGGPNVARYREELAKLSGIPVAGALDKTAVAATNAGGGMATLTSRAKDLAGRMAPTAAAISLVSSSMEGQGGQMGKLVAGAGQVAAAFGAGGPFAAALVAGMAAVSQLTSHLEKLNREQDELIATTYGPIDAAAAQMKKVERDLADLRRDAAGPETVKQAAARVQAEIDAVNAQVAEVIKTRNAMKVNNTEAYFEERKLLEDQRKILEKTVTLLQQKQNLEQGKAATAGLPKTPTVKSRSAAVAPERFDALQNELDLEEKAADWLTKMREEANAHRLKNEVDTAKEIERLEKDRTRNLALEAAERGRIREAETQHAMAVADVITGMSITTAGILADGIAGAAMGQEDAVEQTLAALSRQAGGFITLKGGELLASGIAGTLIAPGNPASLAQLAGGAALVAAGAAVTSGGPAVISSLMGKAGGGGSSPSGAGRDPGASPRSSGGSGGGGPMIINVSYGAGGPLPEDIAREIHKVTSSGNRRSGR